MSVKHFPALRWMAVCVVALLPACVPCQSFGQAAGSPQETVFFSFDDESIPWRDNLKLTLERPQKHPANPVLRAGPPRSVDANGTILYGTVFKDGEILPHRSSRPSWAGPAC